jgi:hypothetical protein
MITPLFEYERVSKIVTNWGILPGQKTKAVLESNLSFAQKQQLLALIHQYTAPPPAFLPPWDPRSSSYRPPGSLPPWDPRSSSYRPPGSLPPWDSRNPFYKPPTFGMK